MTPKPSRTSLRVSALARGGMLMLIGALALLGAPKSAQAERTGGERVTNLCLYPFKVLSSSASACVWDDACPLGQECLNGECTATKRSLAEKNELLGEEGYEKYADLARKKDFPKLKKTEPQKPRTGTVAAVAPPGGDAIDGRETTQQLMRRKREMAQNRNELAAFRQGRGSGGGGTSDESADEECGNDRRCRINRLKRKNRARRRVEKLKEEQYARGYFERNRERELASNPRLKDPIALEIYLSFLGWGLIGGYSVLDGQLRFEGGFQRQGESVYTDTQVGDQFVYFSGYHQGFFFVFNATYMITTYWITPYVSLGFMYGTGSNESYDWDEFGNSSGGTSTVFHAGNIAAGIDVQLGLGLRGRLGANFRPLIYNQASIQDGVYDQTTQQGLEAWWKSDQLIGIDFSIGWAF